MKKRYYLIIVLAFCLFLTGCKKNVCERKGHDYSEVSCENNAECSVCGKILQEAYGHDWIEATCEKAKHCKECGKQDGTPLEHSVVVDNKVDVTCTSNGLTEGSHCSVCNKVLTEQKEVVSEGHKWINATCTNPKTCEVCNETEGTSLEHKWDEISEDNIEKCSSCGLDKIDVEINKIIPNETNKSITLPETVLGYQVTWESSDIDAMLNDGLIVARNDDRKITLIANITVNDRQIKKEFDILVKAVKVSTGQYDVAYDFYASKLSKVLSKNVSLMTSEYNGCTVRYISMDESIITSKGQVTVIKVEQSTIMKIFVIKNNVAVVYNQEINVASFTPANRVNETAKLMDKEIEKFKNGEVTKLPVYNDDYETKIEWKSNVPEFIMTEDIVLTPLFKTNIILDCVITYGETSKEVEYKLENIGGNITEEEFISTLLKYMAKVELKGSKNHLKLVNDEYYLDYQQRINSYGVLNLATADDLGIDKSYYIDETRTDFKNKFFSGKKPLPSQSTLDSIFYPGYQNPNSSNVLFITVHESAMTLEGQNAENLAQIQYRYAFQQDNARQASWHYQVDAYSIYQSFGDDIYGWHAGETNGNKYGIGIEMCVNRDGNYEGTIMNNAKLVASLMLKYNLNFDNVYRHYDHSGKECPSYLIRTGRWVEFVEMTRKEYLIRKYLLNATIEYNLSIDGLTTEEVLAKYFIKGDNGLWFNKPVSEVKEIEFEIKVILNTKSYKESSIIKLLPEGSNE